MLGGIVDVPVVRTGCTSVWAQYTIKTSKRDAVSAELRQKGIPSAVYYPRPLHRQTAYKDYPCTPDPGVSERLSSVVLSLPMHPYLEKKVQTTICENIRQVLIR